MKTLKHIMEATQSSWTTTYKKYLDDIDNIMRGSESNQLNNLCRLNENFAQTVINVQGCVAHLDIDGYFRNAKNFIFFKPILIEPTKSIDNKFLFVGFVSKEIRWDWEARLLVYMVNERRYRTLSLIQILRFNIGELGDIGKDSIAKFGYKTIMSAMHHKNTQKIISETQLKKEIDKYNAVISKNNVSNSTYNIETIRRSFDKKDYKTFVSIIKDMIERYGENGSLKLVNSPKNYHGPIGVYAECQIREIYIKNGEVNAYIVGIGDVNLYKNEEQFQNLESLIKSIPKKISITTNSGFSETEIDKIVIDDFINSLEFTLSNLMK